MGKTAFIFPGQGAQYVGMGKDFFEQLEECKNVFEEANQVLDFDVNHICFDDNEEINITEYTQAAMVTTCIAILRAVQNKGLKPDIVAGLSLGEYCALIANGTLSFKDGVKIARKRGIYMQEAVPQGNGTMSVVLGLDGDTVTNVCKEIEGVVMPANFNCPGQIVISGETNAVAEAGEKLKEAGAKRILPLKVSGPFHSTMLTGAGEKLKEELKAVEIHDFTIPYVSNVTGEVIMDKEQVIDLLAKQVSSSVLWQQSVENMIKEGVDLFVEIGPGKTLSGFIKKISREVKVINIDKLEDLEKIANLN